MQSNWLSTWGTAIKDIGFPSVIALLLLFRIEPAMTALTNAVNWSSYVMGEVQKRLAVDEVERAAMRVEHERILSRLERHERVEAPVAPPPARP